MSHAIIPAEECSAVPQTRRALRPVYIGVVTGLATFLVGLALWPKPPRVYEARTVLARMIPAVAGEQSAGRTASGAEQAAGPVDRQEPLARDTLIRVTAEQAGLLVHTAGEAAYEQQLKALSDRLTFEPTPGPGPRETQWLIRFSDTDRGAALNFVERLAQAVLEANAADQNPIQASADADRLRRQIVQAATLAGTAKEELDAFLQEHWEPRRRGQDVTARSALPVAPAPPSSVGTSAGRQRSPDLPVVEEQLAQMQARRAQLLLTRTPAHPEVEDVEERIRVLRERVEELSGDTGDTRLDDPTGLPAHADPPDLAAPELAGEPAGVSPPPDTLSAEQWSRYEQLSREYQRALAAHQAALTAERAWLLARSIRQGVQLQLVQPAQVERIAGGTLGPSQLLQLSLIATGLGGLLAWLSMRCATRNVFGSVEEVAATLPVPVVASLSTGEPLVLRNSPEWQRHLVRSATRLSEAVVAATLLLVVYRVVAESAFALQFYQHPFAAFGEALGGLLG
jgi:hypothetical protein